MQSHRERAVVRVATLGVLAVSLLLAAIMHTPSSLPSTAFGSAPLFFLERLVLVVAGLLFLLVVLYRGRRGELPLKLSGRGAEWEPIVKQDDLLQDDLAAIEQRLDALRDEIVVLSARVEAITPQRRLR